MIELLGYAAGVVGTGCLIPQVVKTYRTKSANDFSFLYLFFLDVGITLWAIYGLIINNLPLIFANIIGVIFISYILAVRLRGGLKKD